VGNEVEALLDKAKWVARAVAKRRWLALGTAVVVAVAAGVLITRHGERYEARARVYVDTQTVLKPLMAALTYQPDTDQQVRMLARTLISRPNVERLIGMPGFQLAPTSPAERERVVARLMEQIKVVPAATGGNLYDISYRGTSPERAENLVKGTLDLFVSAGVGAKKRDAQEAGRFIEEQIRSYEAKLTEAENRLKEFKMRNFGVSGVSDKDYFARVSTLTEAVNKLRIEVVSAEQSRDAYRRELALEDPQLPPDQAPRNPGPLPEVEARLEAQKKQLDDLLRRYTESHPDVISARRLIAELEAEARARREAEERAAAQSGKSVKASRAATSPIYQKLRISLAEAEARVAALRSELAAQQSELERFRSLASKAPQVEAELAQLNRDYDVIRKNYDQMVARRESASLGAKLDETSQLAEFRVVEPPRVQRSPVFPARLHLALMAIVASLAAGAVAAAGVDALRPTFDDPKALRLLYGRPVLGTVSMLVTPEGQRRREVGKWTFTAALGLLLMLQISWVAWLALRPNLG